MTAHLSHCQLSLVLLDCPVHEAEPKMIAQTPWNPAVAPEGGTPEQQAEAVGSALAVVFFLVSVYCNGLT